MESDRHENDDIVERKQPGGAMPIEIPQVRQAIDRSLLCAIRKIQNESREHKKDIHAQEAVFCDDGEEAIRIELAWKRRRAGCKRNKQVEDDHHHNGESTEAVDGSDLLRAAFCCSGGIWRL